MKIAEKLNQPPSPPLRDSNGALVIKERHHSPARGAGSLELTVSDMTKDEFDEYFKNFHENPGAWTILNDGIVVGADHG